MAILVLRDYFQWVIALQTTEPFSGQRGRPTRRNKRLSDKKNFKIWPWVPTPRRTGRLTVGRKINFSFSGWRLGESRLLVGYGSSLLEATWLRITVCMWWWSVKYSHELCLSKNPINLVTNPNPVYSYSYTWQCLWFFLRRLQTLLGHRISVFICLIFGFTHKMIRFVSNAKLVCILSFHPIWSIANVSDDEHIYSDDMRLNMKQTLNLNWRAQLKKIAPPLMCVCA
jgi:hypothetical protein